MGRRENEGTRPAFTLIELLTVIGIISLLIAVLLPSLSRARAQAKRVKVLAQITSAGKGLELFHNDFRDYPDSTLEDDPIDWNASSGMPPNGLGTLLSGAHWPARALVGHDLQGVDIRGNMLLPRTTPGAPLTIFKQETFSDPDPLTGKPGINSQRKGTYIDGRICTRDTNAQRFPNQPGAATARIVIVDDYNSPLLYYRAHPKARRPFGELGADVSIPHSVYTQEDNAPFTGGRIRKIRPYNGTTLDAPGWDFAGTGLKHGIGHYPSGNDPYEAVPPDTKGKNFVDFFHARNPSVEQIRPVNPDTFILLSAGADGIYGTEDDVGNFN